MTGRVHDLGRAACRACGKAARAGQQLCADDELRWLTSAECAKASAKVERRPVHDERAEELLERAMQAFVERRKQESCPHPEKRRFVFRARFSLSSAFGRRQPTVEIIERCQDCGADVRAGGLVSLDELRTKWNLEPWALEQDPWATPARPAGRGGRRG